MVLLHLRQMISKSTTSYLQRGISTSYIRHQIAMSNLQDHSNDNTPRRESKCDNRDKALTLRETNKARINKNYSYLRESLDLVYDSDTSFSLNLPGFTVDCFTRFGKPSIFSMHKYMNHSGIVITNPTSHNPIYRLSANYNVVTNGVILRFSPQFYTHIHIGMPIVAKTRLESMDLNSYSLFTTLLCGETLVATNTTSIKLLDPETRRAADLPSDVYRMYSPEVKNQAERIHPIPELPESFYTWGTVMNHCDADFHYHVNSGVVTRLCVEAAVNACADGFYKTISGDFMQYDVTKCEVLYRAEMFPNDVISVATWQDTEDPGVIYFLIANRTSGTVANKCRYVINLNTSKL